jgi:hypothetical protein
MHRLAFLAFLPVFAGCGKATDDTGVAEGDTDTDADADTDADTDTDTDTDVPIDTGPATPTGMITSFTGQCIDDEHWSGDLRTADPAEYAIMNFWETNASNGWSEEHELARDAGPTELVLALQHTGDIGAVTSDEADGQGMTLFPCSPGGQLQSTNTMTYAIRVYDLTGAMVECCAFGYTPDIVANGTYITPGGAPSSASELAQCRTTCAL